MLIKKNDSFAGRGHTTIEKCDSLLEEIILNSPWLRITNLQELLADSTLLLELIRF